MTNTFYTAFLSEKYKLFRNRQLFGVLIAPVLLILAIDGYIIYDIIRSETVSAVPNPWKVILGRYVFQFFYLLYPILVALFVYACCDVEYKNNNYKILFTLPLDKSKIFFSKAVFMLLTVLFSILFAYAAFLISGYILSAIYPVIGFQNHDYRLVIFFTFLKLFITLSAIAMIQLALSLIFKSFIYPIGVCMFMLVFSVFVAQKSFSDFIPFTGAYHALTNILSESDSFTRLDYSNMLMIVLFMFVSCYLFKRKGKF
ncbi:MULTISPECIES: ABC transporter permease [unclassified Sphingobacterium]|uniref:ABC transporter permease n=1 Tax=unclassified Sphingobacterium TaxID=2609468 RepID=UPI0025F47C00|nr:MULTISPECIES: ABC transporter permease [unclassified Sphingobacterium]